MQLLYRVTVKFHLTATYVIRSPRYSGHFIIDPQRSSEVLSNLINKAMHLFIEANIFGPRSAWPCLYISCYSLVATLKLIKWHQ